MRFDIGIFLHRYAWVTLACIASHQALVASGTYFLTRLMQAFQTGTPFHSWLYAYCFVMLIPYIPGSLGFIALQRWTNETHCRYVTGALQAMRGWRQKRTDHDQQLFTQTMVGKQELSLVTEALNFVHGFTDFLASSLFNVVVIAVLLTGDLAIGYAISMAVCTATLLLLRRPVERLAIEQERSQIDFATHLTHAWENTVIGNAHNHACWLTGNKKTSARYYSAALRLEITQAAGNILLAALMLLPSIYLIISTLNEPTLIPAVGAALIANLTRIFHVLSGMTALVNQAIACGAVLARARVLFDGWPAQQAGSAVAAVNSPGLPLIINDEPVSSLHDASEFLLMQKVGRYTIRAPNGAGKTTFMQALKFRLSDHGFYLPAHTHGLAWSANMNGLSTGQRMVSHLEEIATLPDITHILLDEWDANLDSKNTALFDQRLNVAAKTKVVIEVRH